MGPAIAACGGKCAACGPSNKEAQPGPETLVRAYSSPLCRPTLPRSSQVDQLAQAACSDKGPLCCSAANGWLAALKKLLDAGWPIDKPCPGGDSALHHASWNGQPGAVALLLERGANVNFRGLEDGRTPLINAVINEAGEAGGDDHVECIDALIAAGAEIDAVDEEGYSALKHACADGDTALAKLLLDKGADKDLGNPLKRAVRNGHAAVARLLVERGARVSLPGREAQLAALLVEDCKVCLSPAFPVCLLSRYPAARASLRCALPACRWAYLVRAVACGPGGGSARLTPVAV